MLPPQQSISHLAILQVKAVRGTACSLAQLAELNLYNGDTRHNLEADYKDTGGGHESVPDNEGATGVMECINPDGERDNNSEGPCAAVDGHAHTKWLDDNFGDNGYSRSPPLPRKNLLGS